MINKRYLKTCESATTEINALWILFYFLPFYEDKLPRISVWNENCSLRVL